MASKIEWTEESWNPVTGCTKVSEGCRHCYAETIANRFWKDRKFTDVQCHEDRLNIPLKRKKPTTYFVNSMSDLFHDKVPEKFIACVWATIAMCQRHRFIVLTKRAERMCRLERVVVSHGWAPLPNLVLGVSAEDQATFDDRVPWLLKTPVACRLISYEPALGPITCGDKLDGIGWVIVGGESGANAREMDIGWAMDVKLECAKAGVPFFFKQYGTAYVKQRRSLGMTGKGGDPAEWPGDWPRQFPPLLKGTNQ